MFPQSVTCLNTFGFQKAFGMSTFSHSLVDQKPLRETIDEWKREDRAAADMQKRSAAISRSSLMTLEKGKFDVFTEDSFGDMEIMQTTETGNDSAITYFIFFVFFSSLNNNL